MIVQFKLKDLGIDPRPVLREVDKSKRKVLGHQGGYLRRVARNSIKRKGIAKLGRKQSLSDLSERRRSSVLEEAKQPPGSQPGSPPFTHTGHIRDDIIYAVDTAAESVSIGAHKFPWLNELLEHGGTTQRQLWLHRPTRSTYLFHRGPKSGKGKVWKFLRMVTTRYPARPFMSAALDTSKDRLTLFWKDAIR